MYQRISMFTDEYKNTELVTFNQDKLSTMGERLEYQVINIEKFEN